MEMITSSSIIGTWYEIGAWISGFLIEGTLLALYVVTCFQLSVGYINDTRPRVFLSRWFDGFDSIYDFEGFAHLTCAFFIAGVVGIGLAFAWPLGIFILMGLVGFMVLRTVRYVIRKRKQFKRIAVFFHNHPNNVDHSKIEIDDVEF